MNITLVCGHYLPKLGYLEVHLARALCELNYNVSVVTSTAVPRYVSHLQSPHLAGQSLDGEVKVIRLRPYYELGQVVEAKGLKEAVLATRPDLLLAIGLGKRFPKPIFDLGIPVVSLFGDNLHSYAGDSWMARLKQRLQFELLKASTYKAAIRASAALVAYTPESFHAAALLFRGHYRRLLLEQNQFISLGFDPSQFYFDIALRQKVRQAYFLSSNDRVLITSTRVVQEKKLEDQLSAIKSMPDEWRWWVVGSDGSAYATSFAEKALAALGPSRFKLIPYQDRPSLNALFNAADMALYTIPAISIFEVLGTGLPCILPEVDSLKHIIEKQGHALSFVDAQRAPALHMATRRFMFDPEARERRAELAREHYAWSSIASRLMGIVYRECPALKAKHIA